MNHQERPNRIRRVLIANRGEVAVRLVRACHKLGLECVVAFSEADRDSMAPRLADHAICVGPAPPAESYLNQERMMSAAVIAHCDAVHPGYGFLAESAAFAEACLDRGLLFIGPTPPILRIMGDKSLARIAAQEAQLSVLPATGPIESLEEVDLEQLVYPQLVKAVAGGGGRGIRLVSMEGQLEEAFAVGRREAKAAFGDGRVFLEKFVSAARHLEVQLVADHHGRIIHLGERECSVQRRYQKVLEEAPALINDIIRDRICEQAVRLAEHIGYQNAGTVEFVLDQESGQTYFLEMNPRLQVEHGVTEMVTELDIVALQIWIAEGRPLPFDQDDVVPNGHAIQWRVAAETVYDDFTPRPGKITKWEVPEWPGIRIDSHCFDGYAVPPFYDSLLAKLIVHGRTRREAIARLKEASVRFGVGGVPTTLDLCRKVVDEDAFRAGGVTTSWLESLIGSKHELGDAQ